MNYVEHHFGDYAKDTGHLSLTEHGAYRMLIDLYYVREKFLPRDVTECCRLARARSAVERTAVKRVLSEFFDLTEEGWRHKRCDAEIARMHEKRNKAKGSANARWNFTQTHSERNANALQTHSEGNAPSNQKPVTSNQKPETNSQGKEKKHAPPTAPPDVSPQVWADFLKLRKGMRAEVTTTALEGLRREAVKAHMTLEQALRMSCERGWRSFKAEWIQSYSNSNGSRQTALEQRNREAGEEFLRRTREPEIFDVVTSER